MSSSSNSSTRTRSKSEDEFSSTNAIVSDDNESDDDSAQRNREFISSLKGLMKMYRFTNPQREAVIRAVQELLQ